MFSPIGGDWEIKEKIGAGTYGSVYRAEKRIMNSVYECAVKHISVPPEDFDANQLISDGMAKDEYSVSVIYKDLMVHFKNEIDICHQLRGNTNIVSYEDHFIFPRNNGMGYDIFIRMELLKNIFQYRPAQSWTEREVVDLGIDICSALEILKRHNIIHRDIKPSNIFVSDDGKYKLGDFGEAKVLSGIANSMTIRGSYPYMSPEIFNGKGGADIRADIYSLGMVMYRLLNNNRAPFVNVYSQTVTSDELELSNQRRFRGEELNIPCNCTNKYLLYAVMKAVSFRPENRWTTPEEFKKYLLSIRSAYDSNAVASKTTPIFNDQHYDYATVKNFSTNSNGQQMSGNYQYQDTIPVTNIPFQNRQMPPVNPNLPNSQIPPVNPNLQNSQMPPADHRPEYYNSFQPPKNQKNNTMIVVIIIAAVLVLVIMGIILALVLGGKSSGGSDENSTQFSVTSSQYSDSNSRYEYSKTEEYSYQAEESSRPEEESSYYQTESKTEESSAYVEPSKEESKTVTVRVASYKDMSYSIAEQKIRQLGLRVNYEYEYSYSTDAGIVMDQSVSPNKEVEENSYITLTVSKGPNFSDVIGKCSYCKQVVDVRENGSGATMTVYNLTDDGWVRMFSCRATVGQNGIGRKYGEGKKVTPEGCYPIGVVLSEKRPPNMDWQETNINTVIVDDLNSPYYNQIKQESSLPSGTSCDHIGKRLHDGTENYSIFIEHNGNGYSSSGVINGNASAITICGRYPSIAPTYGCIDISSSDMISLLNNLDRYYTPYLRTTGEIR